MDSARSPTKHALIIPVCLQGHFFSICRLALDLARNGVTITFVGLAKEVALLQGSESVRALENFNLISYADAGSEHHFKPTGDPLMDILAFVPVGWDLFQPIHAKLIADKAAGHPGPTCIIIDRLLTWGADAAKELDIPCYSYFSAGAIYARELQARAALFDDGTLKLKDGPHGGKFLKEFEGVMTIPGLPPLRYRDMCDAPVVDFVGYAMANDHRIGLSLGKVDGVIINSCYDLEAPQIDALQQTWKANPQGKTPKLFLIGPVPNAEAMSNLSLATGLSDQGASCLTWLERQPPRSVVYVCIGSIAHFTPHQINELAVALERSEQSFLWVVSRGSADKLPPNFAERTKEKGLTVSGWVPQLRILQHSAIGGFMTHCGWNSTIESVISGVPMAGWPQIPNDQGINCRFVVDTLRIGVDVRIGDVKSDAATSEGLEKAVRVLVSDEGKVLRSRVMELKEKVEAALADGGPSRKALKDLVDAILP